jgi:hypothetical protein
VVSIDEKRECSRIKDFQFASKIYKDNYKLDELDYCSLDPISERIGYTPSQLGKLTSSILVSKYDEVAGENITFDVGLKLKNNVKQVHVPGIVR